VDRDCGAALVRSRRVSENSKMGAVGSRPSRARSDSFLTSLRTFQRVTIIIGVRDAFCPPPRQIVNSAPRSHALFAAANVLRACFDLHEAKATEAETFEIRPPPGYGFLCMLTMWLTRRSSRRSLDRVPAFVVLGRFADLCDEIRIVVRNLGRVWRGPVLGGHRDDLPG
jgi:hypothetical protein